MYTIILDRFSPTPEQCPSHSLYQTTLREREARYRLILIASKGVYNTPVSQPDIEEGKADINIGFRLIATLADIDWDIGKSGSNLG